MASDSSFVWHRPATELENFTESAFRKGFFTTVYGLTLRTVAPLSDIHVKDTLLHLFRKMPNLRICFRERGDTLWACEMKREEIDFQVTETGELIPQAEALLRHPYRSTEGPLWCARLLPSTASDLCLRPDIIAAFPYSRTLLLGNHHGIADGTTNVFMINAFLTVLEDVLSERPINDSIPLGKFVAGEETKSLAMAKIQELMKDSEMFEKFQINAENLRKEAKLIPRAYPMPRNPNYRAEIVVRDLDMEKTQMFIKKCKEEGITVNSGFVAVINVSLVDFVREGGLEEDFYRIRETHAVSMRRYWSGDSSDSLGVHMMMIENIVSTPAKWRDNFWKYARNIHTSIMQGINENKQSVYILPLVLGKRPENLFVERPTPECDYGTANMRNLDLVIPTDGQHVRLAHLLRSTSCWNDPMYYLFHTLNGCFMCDLTYANDIITRENAEKLLEITFNNIISVTM